MEIQPIQFDEHVEQFHDRNIDAIKAWGREHDLPSPIHLEIGSNRGRFIEGLARLHPEAGVLGVELRTKWARQAEGRLRRAGLDNAHSLQADANLAIPLLFADATIERVYVLFPDPWWKRRHAKRRIISPAFLQLLAAKIKPGGHLIVKTDVEPYYAFSREVFDDCPQFRLLEPGDPAWPADEAGWPMTTREVKIVDKGLPVYRLYAHRTDAPATPDAVREATLERFPKPDVTIDNPRA